MADVFISYRSARRAAADHLAQILELHGYSVWFDYALLSGDEFADQIERQLLAARAVVVLWCTRSTSSKWVKKESSFALGLGTLIPAWIEPAPLPLQFHDLDTLDLTTWDGNPTSPRLHRLIAEVAGRVGKAARSDKGKLEDFERRWRGEGGFSMSDLPLTTDLERQAAYQQRNRARHQSDEAGATIASRREDVLPHSTQSNTEQAAAKPVTRTDGLSNLGATDDPAAKPKVGAREGRDNDEREPVGPATPRVRLAAADNAIRNGLASKETSPDLRKYFAGLEGEVSSAFDEEALADYWMRYQRGEPSVFSPLIYNEAGKKIFRRVAERHRDVGHFASAARAYISQFERQLKLAADTGGLKSTTVLFGSNGGKLYTMLAHVDGRLSKLSAG